MAILLDDRSDAALKVWPTAMRAIFLSYRRDDAEGEAGRLFDDLVGHFGEDAVFMDVAAIEAGRDFRKAIDESVGTCGVLLALIGREWVGAKNEAGQRKLDDSSDFVRLETASALKRDIPVIPVLLRGATMPRGDQLPDNLKELAYRNAVELTHARWNSDLQLLIKALRPHVEDAANVSVGGKAKAAREKNGLTHDNPKPESRKKLLWTLLGLIAVIGLTLLVWKTVLVPRAAERRALEQKTVAERVAAEKAATDQEAERVAAQKIAEEERLAGEKAAAEKISKEKAAAAAEKIAAENAAAEKLIAEKAAADKALAEKTAAARQAQAEKVAADKAAEEEAAAAARAEADKAAAQRAAETRKALADQQAAEKTAEEAANQKPWLGNWRSVDPNTRFLTKLSVIQNGPQVVVRAWGACHPTDCDWGPANAVETGNGLSVRWNQGFKSAEMRIQAQNHNLTVTVQSVYTDNSGRAPQLATENFIKGQ